MKRLPALFLALILIASLAACGLKNGDPAGDVNPGPVITGNMDEIPDNITSPNNKYEIAFVTDVGQLKDRSFNQATYDGVKLYAGSNGLSYKYYQPANGDNATDDDRYDAMVSACKNGAEVIIAAGYMQGNALQRAAGDFPDTKFVFIDGWDMDLDNVLSIAFNEHECGYFAGYAVVKEGYEKLGFCGGGGGTNPSCCRYGYGFVQGADAAARELNKQIEINYTWLYGGFFSASPEMKALANSWYEAGTQVIFSAGGAIFQSIASAAAANGRYVVGVDTDQSYESDTVITSALKGIREAVSWAISKAYDGSWPSLDGFVSLGAADGATGLPTATWSLKNYRVDEYKAQLADFIAGRIVIRSDVLEGDAITSVSFSNTTVHYIA